MKNKEPIVIIYGLSLSPNWDEILYIPYGYTLNEVDAKEFCNNYSPFKYKIENKKLIDIKSLNLRYCKLQNGNKLSN
jgi:hypothetical protein